MQMVNFMDIMSRMPVDKTRLNKSGLMTGNDTKSFMTYINSASTKKITANQKYNMPEQDAIQEKDISQEKDINPEKDTSHGKQSVDRAKVGRPVGKTSKKPSASDDAEDEAGIRQIKIEDMPEINKQEIVLENLANILYMTPDELKSALTKLGVEPSALTDELKIENAVKQIADFAGMTVSHKQALESIISFVNSQAGAAMQPSQADLNASSNDAGQYKQFIADMFTDKDQAIAKPADKLTGEATPEISDPAVREFLTKLGNMTDMTVKDSVEIFTDIAAAIESFKAARQSPAYLRINSSDVNVSNKMEAAFEESEVPIQQADMNVMDIVQEEALLNSGGNNAKEEASLFNTKKNAYSDKIGNDNNAADFSGFEAFNVNSLQTGSIAQQNGLQRTDEITQAYVIQKDELIGQIIDKASIITDQGKSEMIMDLKPDSLGKLSMKVVTDRGMVVARFIVENSRVKETLEANMQLLKDSLERQGLNIQDVSVSVGQDTSGNSRYNPWNNEVPMAHRYREETVIGVIDKVIEKDMNKQASIMYGWLGSSINMTA